MHSSSLKFSNTIYVCVCPYFQKQNVLEPVLSTHHPKENIDMKTKWGNISQYL